MKYGTISKENNNLFIYIVVLSIGYNKLVKIKNVYKILKSLFLFWLNSICFFEILPDYWVLSKFAVLFLQGLLRGEVNQIQIFAIFFFSNNHNNEIICLKNYIYWSQNDSSMEDVTSKVTN
jgi:hypothetical protein